MGLAATEADGETAALTRTALHLNIGPVHLHQLLDEREADTGTLLEEFAINKVLKAQEDGALLTLIEANALIGHTDKHAPLSTSTLTMAASNPTSPLAGTSENSSVKGLKKQA